MYHLFYVGIVLHLAFMGWIIFWLVRLYFGGGFNPLCVIWLRILYDFGVCVCVLKCNKTMVECW